MPKQIGVLLFCFFPEVKPILKNKIKPQRMNGIVMLTQKKLPTWECTKEVIEHWNECTGYIYEQFLLKIKENIDCQRAS